MKNIVFLDTETFGDDIDLENFKELGKVNSYMITANEQTIQRVKDADIIVTNKVVIDKNIMQNSKNLKLICVAATGMNNIDLQAAKDLNIEVKNVAGYSTKSVVQHTLSMVLYLLEQSAYYDQYAKNRWADSGLFTHVKRPFYEIYKKRWGIIGLGSIGKDVANIASAMGAEVVYYSTSGKNNDTTYKQVDLETLLSTSSIITIHAPLNEQTHHLLNNQNLSLIKEKSVLINVGRGSIVDEEYLAKLVDEKEFYIGLDVMPKEPIDKNHQLLKAKNQHQIHLTPHIAWTSKEARIKLLDGIYKNIKDF